MSYSSKVVTFGSLVVGEIPRVVGTLATFDPLVAFGRSSSPQCDIAEIRLDEIGTESDWLNACRTIEERGIPTLLTMRTVAEGGKCKLTSSELIEVFQQALSVVSAVDVEFKSGLAKQVAKFADEAGKATLVSYHDFKQTPPLDSLRQVVESAAEHADVVKISTMVNSPGDIKVLQSLLQIQTRVPLCVIGMGSLGTCTRTSFPTLGSALTYGYIDIPSAPGQLSAAALVEHLRSVLPKYNEDFVGRHEVLEFV